MRCFSVAGEDINLRDESFTHVSVQIHPSGNDTLLTDNLSDGFDQVCFGIIHTLDAHRTMYIEEESVEG